MRTAILGDVGFYRRRAQIALGDISAQERAFELANYCKRHLETQIDLSKTDLYIWMNQFLNELKKKRKFALRLGKLAEEQAHYTIRPDIVKKLCNGSLIFSKFMRIRFLY